MRVRSSVCRLLVAVLGAALVSCGGGSGVVTPQPVTSAQGNLQIPQSGGSVRLPDTDGITSTLFVDSNGNAPPAAANATTSTTVPDQYAGLGDAGSALAPQDTALPRTPVWYLFFVPLVTTQLPGLPGLVVALPPKTTTAGKQFFVAFYDGTKWNYGVEGPATVVGRTLYFTGTHTPVTLKRFVLYAFEVYSQSSLNPIVTTPNSLSVAPGASKTFTVSETGYTGTFTVGPCKSGSTTVANVSPSSPHGPSATITVTGVATGSCTIGITDTNNQSASVNVTVNQPLLTATPSSLTLNGNTNGTFTVSETGYTGSFTIGPCQSGGQTVATAAPTTAAGPSATITVTPVTAGTCTLAVSDTNGQTTNVTVTVNLSSLMVNPTALIFTQAPSAQTQTVTISEANYTGPFTVTPCVTGGTTIATLNPPSISGPSATLTVASVAPGDCTVMVSDNLGQSNAFTVDVTAANFTVNAIKRR